MIIFDANTMMPVVDFVTSNGPVVFASSLGTYVFTWVVPKLVGTFKKIADGSDFPLESDRGYGDLP